MAGSAGFQATLFTVPLCPSSSSSRSPAGGREGAHHAGGDQVALAQAALPCSASDPGSLFAKLRVKRATWCCRTAASTDAL